MSETIPDKMNIFQCEEIAKDIGYDSATFFLCGPGGRMPCKWLDAYMGLFQIDGQDGFMSSSDLKYRSDIWCEDMEAPADPQ